MVSLRVGRGSAQGGAHESFITTTLEEWNPVNPSSSWKEIDVSDLRLSTSHKLTYDLNGTPPSTGTTVFVHCPSENKTYVHPVLEDINGNKRLWANAHNDDISCTDDKLQMTYTGKSEASDPADPQKTGKFSYIMEHQGGETGIDNIDKNEIVALDNVRFPGVSQSGQNPCPGAIAKAYVTKDRIRCVYTPDNVSQLHNISDPNTDRRIIEMRNDLTKRICSKTAYVDQQMGQGSTCLEQEGVGKVKDRWCGELDNIQYPACADLRDSLSAAYCDDQLNANKPYCKCHTVSTKCTDSQGNIIPGAAENYDVCQEYVEYMKEFEKYKENYPGTYSEIKRRAKCNVGCGEVSTDLVWRGSSQCTGDLTVCLQEVDVEGSQNTTVVLDQSCGANESNNEIAQDKIMEEQAKRYNDELAAQFAQLEEIKARLENAGADEKEQYELRLQEMQLQQAAAESQRLRNEYIAKAQAAKAARDAKLEFNNKILQTGGISVVILICIIIFVIITKK